MSSLSVIPSDLRKEFKVAPDGAVKASQRGVARLCGVDEKSIRNLIKKAKGGADLSWPKSLVTLSQQGLQGADLQSSAVVLIIEYYSFDAGVRCTKQAQAVYRTFGLKGFEQWVHGELGWSGGGFKSEWDKSRLEGKYSRRTLTDAIKSYIERHPKMSSDKKRFLYATTTNRLYLMLFGTDAKALKQVRGTKELRDTMTTKEINAINTVEGIAQRLIDVEDISPALAMRDAVNRALLPGVFFEETFKALEAFRDAMAIAAGDED